MKSFVAGEEVPDPVGPSPPPDLTGELEDLNELPPPPPATNSRMETMSVDEIFTFKTINQSINQSIDRTFTHTLTHSFIYSIIHSSIHPFIY